MLGKTLHIKLFVLPCSNKKLAFLLQRERMREREQRDRLRKRLILLGKQNKAWSLKYVYLFYLPLLLIKTFSF